MLNVNWKNLIDGELLTTSTAIYYTAPGQTKAAVKILTLTNTSGSQVSVNLYRVPRNAQPGAANLLGPFTLGPNSAPLFVLAACHVLEPGDSIQASCTANSAVSIMASGYELT
jgi:hypothetical protein